MTEVDPASESAEPVAPPPVAPAPAEEEDRPLNAEGRERPRFLLKFPDDPELQRLARAFEAGNATKPCAKAPASLPSPPKIRSYALQHASCDAASIPIR